MADQQRIVVTLPSHLVREIDGIAAQGFGTRAEVIAQVVQRYLADRRRHRLRESLKVGYREMAAINLALAEEGLAAENETFPLLAERGHQEEA
ncbi:MAG: hypothetical protein IRY95_00955 [Clostridia bacterium]|nr:hypothetical protein [Clostridia bacterium]